MPNWTVKIARRVEKTLDRLPAKDQRLILQTLDTMTIDPFSGDIVRLRSERSAWRRRVGNYRLFFDVYSNAKIVDIVEIERRTSKTY